MSKQAVAPGIARWDQKQQRWLRWSGRRWAPATYSLEPTQLEEPAAFEQNQPVSAAQRGRALQQAVEAELLLGATLVNQSDFRAVLDYRRPVSHVLHAVLSLFTAGLWVVVWVVMAIARRSERRRLTVDQWGHVWTEDGGSTT